MSIGLQAATLSVLGRSIRHVTGGEGDDAYIFIHGFGGDHTTWMFTLSSFFSLGRVYALDLPAHGGSDVDVGPADIAFFVGLLGAYLDSIGVTRAHLTGHSLGGAISLEFTLAHPERVASLSLIAAVGLGPPINRNFVERFPGLRHPDEAQQILALLVADPRMIGEQMVGDALAHLAQPGVTEALRAIAEAVFPAGRQLLNYRDRLCALTMPARVIWGEHDKVLGIPEGFDARIPFHVIARAGHLPHMEASAKVNRLLMTPPAARA